MFTAMKDYTKQQTDLIFTNETQPGDMQCLGVPIIDNNRSDSERFFTVSIVSFVSLVRVVPGYETTTVTILDNDGKKYIMHAEKFYFA